MIKQNVIMKEVAHYSAWRKISLGSWRIVEDSQVYCELELPVEKVLKYLEEKNKTSESKITITHFLGKAFGKILHQTPELNRLVARNRIYQRENSDIFFHISYAKTELSGHVVRSIDTKDLSSVAKELTFNSNNVREDKDETFNKIKNVWDGIPNILVRKVLQLIGFISYGLNLNIKPLNIPQDAFGSMMITNIGSLGFERAYVPIAAYTHIPLIAALGKIRWTPWCSEDGSLESRKVVSVCITFDHRIIDGAKGAEVYKKLQYYFENPTKL